MPKSFNKFLKMDDGFQPELIQNASLDGLLQIPSIDKEAEIKIPKLLVPYSKLEYCTEGNKFGCFYEMDVNFIDAISNPSDEVVLNKLRTCAGVITPDCSVYINAPLCVQMMSIYRSRTIGAFFQSQGIYTVVNVRWGDDRTYTTKVLPEPIAFLGVPKKSIVSIGTYGAMRNKEVRQHFRNGLIAMLDYLEPRVVLVYGPMPDEVFEDLLNRTKFVRFNDWTKMQHGGLQ